MKKFFTWDRRTAETVETGAHLCSFGITEAIGAAISSFLVADVGVSAATAGTLGTIGAGALEGGAIGAITDPRNPLKGAEFGAITGGVASGAAPLIGSATGLGTTATDAIAGALGGAAAGGITGGNIGTSALEGGIGGTLKGALTPSTSGTPPTSSGGPTGSAVSAAAPSSVAAAAAPSPAEGISPVTVSGINPTTAATFGKEGFNLGTDVFDSNAAVANAALAQQPAAAAAAPGATGTKEGGISGFLKQNPWALPAGALALEATKSSKLPGESQLSASAAQLSSQGKQLQNYFNSGTLPPGIQSGITQAANAAQASIKSMYASRGMSGSSAEAQDLQAVMERAQTQGAGIAIQLLQQGVSETNMADELYLQLMNNALTQDQQMGQAIANFASALVPAKAA